MIDDLDARIRALVEAKGYKFRPWEVHPAEVDAGTSPWPGGTMGAQSWPKAQKLRGKLIAERKGVADE